MFDTSFFGVRIPEPYRRIEGVELIMLVDVSSIVEDLPEKVPDSDNMALGVHKEPRPRPQTVDSICSPRTPARSGQVGVVLLYPTRPCPVIPWLHQLFGLPPFHCVPASCFTSLIFTSSHPHDRSLDLIPSASKMFLRMFGLHTPATHT